MFKKKQLPIITVALVGNPNSGKTSLFNVLVKSNQKVGNFSGVTIEKFEGLLRYQGYEIKFIDLPGTYSVTAYSIEEIITRNFIIENKPDLILDVVEATNIERNLYLTTQLLELNTNLILTLNMFDEVEKQNIKINHKLIEDLLGIKTIPVSAVKKIGIKAILNSIIEIHEKKLALNNKLFFRIEIEDKIQEIETILNKEKSLIYKYNSRWLAIKLLENDQEIYKLVKDFTCWLKIEPILQISLSEFKHKFNSDPELAISEDRYALIQGIIKETVIFPKEKKKTITEYIDAIFLNRLLGLPLFLIIMWLIFQFTFKLGSPLVNILNHFFNFLGIVIASHLPDSFLKDLLVNGIISGVGSVISFVPNIFLLFFALAFLEATGYMARAAFVVDRIMHKLGLHGKSFIPMMLGFGCTIPALMATRTLKNQKDRIITMMIIPFMSCGARLPLYVILISAFFPNYLAGTILFGVYLFGVIMAFLSAKLLKLSLFKGESEPFVMELPPYRLPLLNYTFIQAILNSWLYLKKAGTIILVATVIIWGASNFPVNKNNTSNYFKQKQLILAQKNLDISEKKIILYNLDKEKNKTALEYSLIGRSGKLIEPVIKPLGFNWQIGIALMSGVAAKEIVVSTLATIYSVGEENSHLSLTEKLRQSPDFSLPVALALMVFTLLYIPCIASLIIFYKEVKSIKYFTFFIFYIFAFAWIASFATYHTISFLLNHLK
ncbi:MAG: ferrous iron transport protein B [Candidatus Margulisiibacteriota bacterium]|jgi:ferrous iron transport protein B